MFARLRSPWVSGCALIATVAMALCSMSSADTRHAPQSKLIAVDNNVHLQYLDFGGNGPALVFLPGLGSTAYIFGDFAPRFTDKYHVYALTRRGYGSSDLTNTGYDLASRVEDLQSFLQALGIKKPILAGHSIAGDEMTAFATKYPNQVAALIYLDAAYDRSDPRAPKPDPTLMAKVKEGWYGAEAQTYPSLEARRDKMKRIYFGVWSDAQEKNMREISVLNVDGSVSDRTPSWVDAAISDDAKKQKLKLQDVKAPALLLFARQRLENRPIKLDRSTRRDLIQEEDKYEKYFNRYVDENRRRNMKISVLRNTMHGLFLEKPAEVAKMMRMFLAERDLLAK
jgi:pimeloyl-ACP methyl ester carboxylesterase